MTRPTYESIRQTVCDQWEALHGEASPADVYGVGAQTAFPLWAQSLFPKVRLKSSEVWDMAKAVKARSDGLKRAKLLGEDR